jgi:hypothetical protein
MDVLTLQSMKRLLSILVLCFLVAVVHAQQQENSPQSRKLVVVDMETRVPIRNVYIIANTGYRDTTNYRGVCRLPEKFDTLIVYKPNYLSEKLAYKEVKDTAYLLPNSHRIGEVTVWGEDRERALQERVNEWTSIAAKEGAANAPSGVAFDFAKMIDKRYRHDQKQLKKTRKAFSNFDKKGNEDPIVAAYNKALEQERLKKERAEVAQRSAHYRDSLKESNNQKLIQQFAQQAQPADTVVETLPEGLGEQQVRNQKDGELRHIYYLQAAMSTLKNDTTYHRMSDEEVEQATFITRDRSKSWAQQVLKIINSELADDKQQKLSEDDSSLRALLYVTQNGDILLAELMFKDPYQGVMTYSQINSTLSNLQHLRLPGVDGVDKGTYFLISVWYEK